MEPIDTMRMYKEILVKENMFNGLKEELLNDPASQSTIEVIKSYGHDTDTAILMIIEIAQTQDDDLDYLGGF